MKDLKVFFFSTPGAILIGAILISFSILLSGGIIKVKGVSQKQLAAQAAGGSNQVLGSQEEPTAVPTEEPSKVQVSVDDDPVLGDKNAPLTLIEFSDYECPYCKRHFELTFPELKKDYIDNGKIKLVFRDLPLPFHDPLATQVAVAGNCVREQIGDSGYFKFHSKYFKKTKSGGGGTSKDEILQIATDLGLNTANFKSCLDSDKYKEEISKDIADANAAGGTGTPTFCLGKSTSNGVIEGTIIVGAQPFWVFKSTIDQLLAQ